MKDFDRHVIPLSGLDEVIVEEGVMRQLNEIVQFEKASYVKAIHLHDQCIKMYISYSYIMKAVF